MPEPGPFVPDVNEPCGTEVRRQGLGRAAGFDGVGRGIESATPRSPQMDSCHLPNMPVGRGVAIRGRPDLVSGPVRIGHDGAMTPDVSVAGSAVDVILRDGSTLRLHAPTERDVDGLVEFFNRLSQR